MTLLKHEFVAALVAAERPPIDRCPGCGKPAHASESDDDNYHAGCRPKAADTNGGAK